MIRSDAHSVRCIPTDTEGKLHKNPFAFLDSFKPEEEVMIGLILEGGGMRAGFVAGALMALMDKGLSNFSFGVAVSASVPTLAYFASEQREEMEQLWRFELSTPRFVCYRNIPSSSLALSSKRPILDLDYLVYEVFKKKYPLDMESLLKSKIACSFALTKIPERQLAILQPADNDIYGIFKAAMAVPGCYPGSVRLNGNEYVDGGTVNPLPAGLLFQNGVDRTLAILSTPQGWEHAPLGIFERALFWRYFQRYDWMVEKFREAARSCDEQIGILRKMAAKEPPSAFIIRPDEMPQARFITRDPKKINRTIDMGYRKVEEREDQIRDFLEEDTWGPALSEKLKSQG